MKTQSELEERIRTLLSEELSARVVLAGKRLPRLCVHNHRHTLDVRKKVEDEVNVIYNRITTGPHLPVLQTIGLCMLGSDDPESWAGDICEDPIDAQRCPYFSSKLDKQELWRLFTEQVGDIDWLRNNMPEVHALLWVLGAQKQTQRLPWWRRLWFRLRRISLEPLIPTEDITKLLPPL
jgi:hypothetical protein